jgi:hypothetical protein
MKKLIYTLTTLALVMLVGWILLFNKVEDKFTISKIELRKVQLLVDSETPDIVEYLPSNDFVRIGIGITITKEFEHDSDSPRQLVFAAREPGINGLVNKDQLDTINVYLGDTSISHKIYCFNFSSQNPENFDFNEQEGTTFSEVLNMLAQNDRKVSGIRLNNIEKFFWVSKKDSATIALIKSHNLRSSL